MANLDIPLLAIDWSVINSNIVEKRQLVLDFISVSETYISNIDPSDPNMSAKISGIKGQINTLVTMVTNISNMASNLKAQIPSNLEGS